MRCNILALLAFAALTTSAVLPADIPQDVDRRELDLVIARQDLVERYEPIGRRLVINGGAAVSGGAGISRGAALSGSAAETGGAAISGGAAETGGAAISGGAAETTGGAAKTTGAAQTTGAVAETTGGAAETTSAAQTTGSQPTAAATSAAPTSGGSCSDIPYGSSLSRPFQIKIIPSTTTQPATSGPPSFLSSLLNILGSLFGGSSNSKGGQSTSTPGPAYLSSQGYPTSQQDAGTFSILETQGYLVRVDPKSCRPSPDCTGYYSGNLSDVTTDIPPFHSLTFTSSLDQTQAASLNGRWIIQTPNLPASLSWPFNFWPFSNRGKPSAQPQADPTLVLINPAFGTPGSLMNFGALVTEEQFSSSTQVSGTGSSTYQIYPPDLRVNLIAQFVRQ